MADCYVMSFFACESFLLHLVFNIVAVTVSFSLHCCSQYIVLTSTRSLPFVPPIPLPISWHGEG